MDRISKSKRSEKKKNMESNTEEPKLILDVIEEDYPEKYETIRDKISQIGKLFTNEEWISILTKSRGSYDSYLSRKNNKK